MPQGEDKVGRVVASFLCGMVVCLLISAFFWPDTEEIRVDLRTEIRAEMYAERKAIEAENELDDLVWAIKRIDKDLDEIWDRIEIADLLEENREKFMEDLN